MDNEVIKMHDEDGNEYSFYLADVIKYSEVDYGVLISTDEDDEDVLIMRINGDGENIESFDAVSDEIYDKVFAEFKKHNKDSFNF